MAALVDSEMCYRVPVIVILGATGSGKSKLGIEIAKRFSGEIISADSMQAYKGLDIVTNKVTPEEQAEAPHHLLDVVMPPRPFSVVEFRDAAVPIVERLRGEGKLPVVVGGTNYYIEALLWKVLVTPGSPFLEPSAAETAPSVSETGRRASDAAASGKGAEAVAEPAPKRPRLDPHALETLPSPELHRRLHEVDPDRALSLHPNNRRRIIRSLEVFEQTGRRHSDILREQRQSKGGGPLGGPLRYSHAAIFWLQCDQATLDARLDSRVDDMIQRGLVEELLDFHARYNARRLAENKEADYTKGIFQSIGFKEFHEYLILDAEERTSERGQKLFQSAVEALKAVTRRYARKQVRWVTNRFLRQPKRQVPPVYAFDTSDPSKWNEVVYEPAVQVVQCLMQGEESTAIKPLPVEEPLTNEPTSFHCDVCERVFIGNLQWEAHMGSKRHKKQVLRQKAKLQSEQSAPQKNGKESHPEVPGDKSVSKE